MYTRPIVHNNNHENELIKHVWFGQRSLNCHRTIYCQNAPLCSGGGEGDITVTWCCSPKLFTAKILPSFLSDVNSEFKSSYEYFLYFLWSKIEYLYLYIVFGHWFESSVSRNQKFQPTSFKKKKGKKIWLDSKLLQKTFHKRMILFIFWWTNKNFEERFKYWMS